MPRSGTTWIGKIFDSCPTTRYFHEPDTRQRIPLSLFTDPRDSEAQRCLREYAARIPSIRDCSVIGKTPLFHKASMSRLGFELYRLGVLATKGASRYLPVGKAPYVPRLHADEVVVWKSIESLGRTGTLLEAIAGIQVIQILRHPCGYLNSVMEGDAKRHFTGQTASSEDMGIYALISGTATAKRYGLDLDRLAALPPWQRLAWRWVVFNEEALHQAKGSTAHHLVRYEDLCKDPKSVTRQLFDFCQLPYRNQTDAFLGESTAREEARYYSVYKDPMKSAWKWKRQLAPEMVEDVRNIVLQTEIGGLYQDAF